MSRYIRQRYEPSPQRCWGLYNSGNLWDVYRTRRQAVQAAEKALGQPWVEAREYMEVHKVIVTKVTP